MFHGDLATGIFSDVLADSDGASIPFTIVSVGEDEAHRLYLLSTDGTVLRMAAVDAKPDEEPPSTPAALVANAPTSTTVELAWRAATDNVGVAGYRVLRDGVTIDSTPSTVFVDMGLDPETRYTYAVVAFDAAGNSSTPSLPTTITTPPADTTPPSIPQGLEATEVLATSIALGWQASSDDTGVANYRVIRDDDEVAVVTTTAWTDENVAAQMTYEYTVTAEDLEGNVSLPSEALEVTTPAVLIGLFEDFETFGAGSDPPLWRATGAGNSMVEAPSLFQTAQVGLTLALGTTSTLVNIHSHYDAVEARAWAGYRYSGRLYLGDADGGVGVTAYSQYREGGVDGYYRVRRYAGEPAFHLAPHGTTVEGSLDTGVVPIANTWYRFVLEVEDTGERTEIRAKIWPDGNVEPGAFQAIAFDNTAGRLTAGTIGLWAMGPGEKYLDDVTVEPLATLFADGFESGDTSMWSTAVP